MLINTLSAAVDDFFRREQENLPKWMLINLKRAVDFISDFGIRQNALVTGFFQARGGVFRLRHFGSVKQCYFFMVKFLSSNENFRQLQGILDLSLGSSIKSISQLRPEV